MNSRAQKRQSITAFHHYSNRGLSCDHCKLIDSGAVAMYQITCPKCGEIPPGRRHLYPNISSSDVGAIINCMKLDKNQIWIMRLYSKTKLFGLRKYLLII